MLRIGIIGAGSISEAHMGAYKANGHCELAAIADVNEALAKSKAEKYGIKNTYTDYHDILKDSGIDAVSVAVPTFLHKNIVIEALKSGKHVLCEKPPALNADEVAECTEAAKKYNKLLMFGFVCRFQPEIQYLKQQIVSGKMGKILYSEASRIRRCFRSGGWFFDKSKSGGGMLMDGAVHEVDCALYLMGYPKAVSVTGFTSHTNKDLQDKLKGGFFIYSPADKSKCKNDVETIASGYVKFENGANLFIKASSAMYTVMQNAYIDISGENAGARFVAGQPLKYVDCLDGYFREITPDLNKANIFECEINHFVDCCINNTECICKPEQAIWLMQIMDAIYKSAETGKEIKLN